MKGSSLYGPIRDENPCYNCQKPKRHTACHGKCKDHAKWKGEVERANENRRRYEKRLGAGIRKIK